MPRGDQYVRCDGTDIASFMPGWIEIADLNQDGQGEAWVRESITFCYGNAAEAFVLQAQDVSGAWVKNDFIPRRSPLLPSSGPAASIPDG